MTDLEQHFTQVMDRWFRGNLSEKDIAQLIEWRKDPAFRQALPEILQGQWEQFQAVSFFTEEQALALGMRITQQYPAVTGESAPVRHRIHFLRTAWFRYAAAILFIAGIAAYLWNRQPPVKTVPTAAIKTEITPGTNKAILMVGDKAIDLSSQKKGIVINKSITYIDGEPIAAAGQLLQLTTPRGGQYQAVLPDGSKVWLNAASGIKFPSRFGKGERRVEITGEVYLEVVQNAKQPFRVQANATTVEVLGTRFNINAYSDEPALKTTLLKGSVKIIHEDDEAVLQPGEQAVIEGASMRVERVNTEAVVAWKNGRFNLEGATVENFMKQLSRWYDITIKYKGKIPSGIFHGEMGRDLELKQVLEVLPEYNIHYKLEGRTLTIE